MDFLRREINAEAPLTLPDPNPNTPGNQAYIAQSDPFFSQLAAWGDTIWQLWLHNKDLPGAAPVLMTRTQRRGGALLPSSRRAAQRRSRPALKPATAT